MANLSKYLTRRESKQMQNIEFLIFIGIFLTLFKHFERQKDGEMFASDA